MSQTLTIERPDTTVIASESKSLVDVCLAYEVIDQKTYEFAGEHLRNLKSMQKQIKGELNPSIEKANAAHKELTGLRKRHLEPVQNAESSLKSKMAAWHAEQERIRREEERRLREEERKREEEKRLAEAEALEKQGKEEEAIAVIEQPVVTAPVVVKSTTPKVEGVSMRETWRFVVKKESLIPRQFLMVDEKKLGAHARSMKGAANVPGVEFYAENTVAARSAF